jgi:hypothetical protein
MPNTSTYGFDYESPTSLPGTTLTGGPTSTLPILAVQVDAALAALNSTVVNQAASIVSLQSQITTNQTDITNLTSWSRRGTVLFSFVTQSSATIVVNFGFTFPSTPTVVTNIDSGAGAVSRWISRAILINTTGFTMFVHAADGATSTWTDIPVSYMALYRA